VLALLKSTLSQAPNASNIRVMNQYFNNSHLLGYNKYDDISLYGFVEPRFMNTLLQPTNGMTSLYQIIIESANRIINFDKTFNNIKNTFIVLSDRQNTVDNFKFALAKQAIQSMNNYGINTYFFTYGIDLYNHGQNLGFKTVVDVMTANNLTNIFQNIAC